MTGYGRCREVVDGRDILVEVKSVNSRYIDANIKTGRLYNALEEKLKSLASAYISRGKVDKIPAKVAQYMVKLMLFNGFLVLIVWITETLLSLPTDWGSLGKALYILGNVAFILFDFAIGRLAVFYIVKIKNRLRKH